MDARKRTAVVGLVLATTLGGGIAAANWMISGTGSVGGAAGTPTPLTITDLVPSSGLLFPGGTGALTATVTNPNGFAVQLQTVTLGAVSSATAGCPASDVTLPATSYTPSVRVPANGSQTLSLPAALTLSLAAADLCKGAVFAVAATATGVPVA